MLSLRTHSFHVQVHANNRKCVYLMIRIYRICVRACNLLFSSNWQKATNIIEAYISINWFHSTINAHLSILNMKPIFMHLFQLSLVAISGTMWYNMLNMQHIIRLQMKWNLKFCKQNLVFWTICSHTNTDIRMRKIKMQINGAVTCLLAPLLDCTTRITDIQWMSKMSFLQTKTKTSYQMLNKRHGIAKAIEKNPLQPDRLHSNWFWCVFVYLQCSKFCFHSFIIAY